jgi:hypothetical protein
MQPHSNPRVDWSLWWGSRQRDVRHPEKMFSRVDRDGHAVCQLCQASVAAWQRLSIISHTWSSWTPGSPTPSGRR